MIRMRQTLRAGARVQIDATRPIPILLTLRELNYGGIERDVTKIAMSLDHSRFEPHVGVYRTGGMRYEELRAANVPMIHLPVSSLKSPTAFLTALRLRRYIRTHGIRLVHAYDTSAVFVVPVARMLGVPVVLSSTLGSRDLLDRRSRYQLRWTDKLVDGVIVNCRAMHRHMVDSEQMAADRIELCFNGVDISEFHPGLSSISRPDPTFWIGSVCVFRHEKSLDLLLEAFARIRHLKEEMKLVLLGGGPELENLQIHSRRLGIEKDCLFCSATPNVSDFLRACDIFVLPSRSEAFSNSLLEAMACGCCAVASSVGGTPELINNERGLLFRSGDAGDLAAKLAQLIRDDHLRKELGARAGEFANMNFRMEIAARRMAEIYEKMLRRKIPSWAGFSLTVQPSWELPYAAHPSSQASNVCMTDPTP